MLSDIFFKKQKKRLEQFEQRNGFLDENIKRTSQALETNVEIQKGNMEIAWKSQLTFEEVKNLIFENEKTKNILLERENNIKKTIDELDERRQLIRKEEIFIETRKSDLRRKEQLLEQQLNKVGKERIEIKGREVKSEKIKSESQNEK